MKICMVGCGVALPHQAAGINEFSGAQIVGVCDIDANKAQMAAKRYNIRNSYTDLTAMMKEQQPDVVHVLTPPRSHAALSIQAMEMGAHVLVEKPMAINGAEADEMIKVAQKNNVKLCLMHNHLFDPVILKAEGIINSGALGELLYMEGIFCLDVAKKEEENMTTSEHWAYHLPMGIFGEYTPHMIYLLAHFMGKMNFLKVLTKKMDKSIAGCIKGIEGQADYEKGMGHFLMLDDMPYYHFTLHLYGTKAVLHINMLDLTMTVEKERKMPKTAAKMLSTVEQAIQNLGGTAGNIVKILMGKLKRRQGHRNLIARFYESILNNTQVPVTPEEGKEVVRILEMIDSQVNAASPAEVKA